MEHPPGNVTPIIIHTAAPSSAVGDPDFGPIIKDTRAITTESPSETSSVAESSPTRQTHSSTPKSSMLDNSMSPSSSRNSSLVVEVEDAAPEDKEILSDGLASCSTTMSNDSEDMVHSERLNHSRLLDLNFEGSITSQLTMGSTQTFHSAITFLEPEFRAPIVGFEIMEQRAKFTVFKIHVQFSETENWFIFRRYTDFVRLNDRLRPLYPSFRLSLPPKRWFGFNFDRNFLEDRQLGLQAFLNNVTGHKDIVQSDPVREFLCLDDPPGAHDSLEESRALCESMEETVYNLRKDLARRDILLTKTNLELSEARQRIAALLAQAEKAGVQLSDFNRPPSIGSDSSTVDFQSRVEADQAVVTIDQQYRQEHRVKKPTENISTLSPETRSTLSSPNCNINNSTEYSVNSMTSLHEPPECNREKQSD